MYKNYGTPYPALEYMGVDETPAQPTNTAAGIITAITQSLASVANAAISAFSAPKTTPAPAGTISPVINIPAQQAAGISPTTLIAIGIPAAIIVVAMVTRRK